MAFRVVSAPAATRSVKAIWSSSSLRSRRPRRRRGRVAVDERRQQVGAGRAALRLQQGGAVGEQPGRRGAAGVVVLAEVAVVVGEGGVGPGGELVAVVGGHAEQEGHGPQGQLRGQRGDHVDLAGGERGVDAGRRHRGQLRLHRREGPGREERREEAADPLVARVVHHVEEHAGREPDGQVLEDGAAAVATATAHRGVRGRGRRPRRSRRRGR